MKKYNILSTLLISLTLTGCSISDIPVLGQVLCGHDYVEKEVIEPTCQRVGSTTYECSKCGAVKTVTTPKVDHSYLEEEAQAATCSEEGSITYRCKWCGDSYTETTEKIPHTYTEITLSKEATCTEDGLKTGYCTMCNDIVSEVIPALGHDFEDVRSGSVITRTCKRCGYSYTETVVDRTNYNMDVLTYDYDTSKSSFDTLSELRLYYSAAIFNMTDSFSCKVNFTFDDLSTLLNDLEDHNSVGFNHTVSAKQSILGLEFDFTYGKTKVSADTEDRYKQLNSLNYQPTSEKRSSSFDDFAISRSDISYPVSTSDQLYYVLERFVNPECKEGSEAETYYNKLKNVLRNIISDGMSDYEKIKAIHDYLVMNVTYDKTLYNNFGYQNSSELSKYKGFYIDGVLDDNRAVCEGIAKTFTCLANMEGIPCVMVTATQTYNPTGAGHAYNKVYLDGKWYIADATSDGVIVNNENEILNYDYFLISESIMKKEYTGKDYTNLACNDTYNPFKEMYYEGENDFNLTSAYEIQQIMKYFNNTMPEGSTISVFLDYNYGSSEQSAVSNACAAALISGYGNFSYLTSDRDGYITITK